MEKLEKKRLPLALAPGKAKNRTRQSFRWQRRTPNRN